MTRTFVGFLGLVSLLAGCTMETASPDEEPLGEVADAVNKDWDDAGFNAQTVGIAIMGDYTYLWRSDGMLCVGFWSAPCVNVEEQFYSAPGDDFDKIVGVGIAKDTSHVYAWYSDSTMSEGYSDNLTAYSMTKKSFTRPLKPNSTTEKFAMSALIEVDNSDNGEWYYYWKSGSLVFRTTGDSRWADRYSKAQQVTIRSSGPDSIVGIAFGNGSPASVYTYYNNDILNVSTRSLVLSQL